jgi:ribosomal protein S18 acetylase RimI-like enzyme
MPVTLIDDGVQLRPTGAVDLDFVCSVEQAIEYRGLIGQWSVEKHFDACRRFDQEHLIIERSSDKTPVGYLITYDLRREGLGVYLKRIAVATPAQSIGRRALRLLVTHAFAELRSDLVWLDVHRTNERAQRAYMAVGFTNDDTSSFDRTAADSFVGRAREGDMVMQIWSNL